MTDSFRSEQEMVNEVRNRLGPALVAALGVERGNEALAEVLGYAWEHRDRLAGMDHPLAYLFRVGQSRSRWVARRAPRAAFPPPQDVRLPDVEPRLIAGLAGLTERQRVCVVLISAYEWTHDEVATLLGLSRSTVQTHSERGIAALRRHLGETCEPHTGD